MKKLGTFLTGAAVLSGLLVIGSVLEHQGSRAQGAYASPVQVMNTTGSAVPTTAGVPAQPILIEATSPGSVAFGPGTGSSYAITSLTFTNLDAVSNVVRVFQPVLQGGSAGTCFGAQVIGGGTGERVSIPSGQTVHLAFPTPIVFTAGTQQNCAGVTFTNNNSSVSVIANGFWQ